MPAPDDLDRLSHAELKGLVVKQWEQMVELQRLVAALRDEIARLKGGPGRPNLKPSGMERGTEPKPSGTSGERKRPRGSTRSKLVIDEERTVTVAVPPRGSRFKGYTSFVVQDLVIRPHVVNFRCERWQAPDGGMVTAPLPAGIDGHFGPELRRFVLAQYHQGQTTVPRLVTLLRGFGIVISKRQVMRLLINGQASFRDEARDVIARLVEHPDRCFAGYNAWNAHLEALGVSALKVNPDPVMVATEAALWGSVKAHGFLPDTVIVSDDAGQFNVGQHGLCWVHSERLVHKLDAFTDENRTAQATARKLIWNFYRDLKAYRCGPTKQRKAALRARFDRIFKRKTGFVTLDRLLARLNANKPELLMVLDRPEIPLHTNGSENDIRCHVTRRKVSAGTRSDIGRDCRDAFLGLAKTCAKLEIAFWDYLGDRLAIPGAHTVPRLPEIILARAQSP